MTKTKFGIIASVLLLFTAFMLFSVSQRHMSETRVEANETETDLIVISGISIYQGNIAFNGTYARLNMNPSWAEGEYPYAKDGYFHIAAEGDLNGIHVNITASLKQGSKWEDVEIPAEKDTYVGKNSDQSWIIVVS